MRSSVVALLLITLCSACNRSPESARDVEEWRHVLGAKKAAAASDDPKLRDAYAERLLRFIKEHPDHPRARSVYDDLERELAEDLAQSGEYDRALRYLRDVATRNPKDARLRDRIDELVDQQSVDAAELNAVPLGATSAQVRQLLGAPPRGWVRKGSGTHARYESWFYRNAIGGVAAVHFDQGRVIARDYHSARTPSNS